MSLIAIELVVNVFFSCGLRFRTIIMQGQSIIDATKQYCNGPEYE